jgi:hypothetical protein
MEDDTVVRILPNPRDFSLTDEELAEHIDSVCTINREYMGAEYSIHEMDDGPGWYIIGPSTMIFLPDLVTAVKEFMKLEHYGDLPDAA